MRELKIIFWTVATLVIFGAGIFLVAQIYHIDEHFPNAFIIWALGALALAWAMPSIAQGILAAVLVSIWCGSESIAFSASMNSGPLIIVALLGSLAYVKRSRVLLAVLIPAFLASLPGHQASPEDRPASHQGHPDHRDRPAFHRGHRASPEDLPACRRDHQAHLCQRPERRRE